MGWEKMRKVSFIIPYYSSEKTIINVVHEIEDTIKIRRHYVNGR